jgi:hypothetical protein
VIDELMECIPADQIEYHMEQLPSGLEETEAELDAAIEIKERYDRLFSRRDSKIRELGYDPD